MIIVLLTVSIFVMPSFYSLDYLIEINEKRLEQYTNLYLRNIDKFTYVFIIYSTMAIFLVPIVQTLFFSGTICLVIHYVVFFVFLGLFTCSVVYAVKLLIPVEAVHLVAPSIYYEDIRLEFEELSSDRLKVDELIKASYLAELEAAILSNRKLSKRKWLFYQRAFVFALLACVPYLICLGFHLRIKEDKVQKVEIVNKFSNFNKIISMKNTIQKAVSDPEKGIFVRGIKTNLPGINKDDVIVVEPLRFRFTFFTNPDKPSKLRKYFGKYF